MILGDVEETVTTAVIDDETYEEIFKVGMHSCPPALGSVLSSFAEHQANHSDAVCARRWRHPRFASDENRNMKLLCNQIISTHEVFGFKIVTRTVVNMCSSFCSFAF